MEEDDDDDDDDDYKKLPFLAISALFVEGHLPNSQL